jgi:hypothetical protein
MTMISNYTELKKVDDFPRIPCKDSIDLNGIYRPSEDVVARDISGEIIIIPITAGIGNMEDDIFSLNETGRAIWDKLDGTRRLKEVVSMLSGEYSGENAEIEKDVLGIVEELLKRKMLIAN